MDVDVDVSVVIGFRDWGVERLRRSVRSIQGAAGDLALEVIISDYGSDDPSHTESLAAELKTRRVFTPREPVWSRARALNVGFAEARGALLVATDADMVFAPSSLEVLHAEAQANEPCALFLQSRDLPEDIPVELFDDPTPSSWEMLERTSVLRPRWGMGGMVAVNRRCMALLNGFDERLHTYGREDLDFAIRARRAGYRTAWAQSPRARMYHMWHPQTTEVVAATSAGRAAVARNRRIVDGDSTTTRNVTRRSAVLGAESPLVSIIVAPSPDGSSAYETVATALAQSVQAVEVIVVQPSTTSEEALPKDSRLRPLPAHDAHVDRSLRAAVESSRGAYVAVVRAGDLLPLDRTERLLTAVVAAKAGSTGGLAVATADGGVARPSLDDHGHGSLLRTHAMLSLLDDVSHAGQPAETFMMRARRAGLALAEVGSTVTIRPALDAMAAHEPLPADPLRCLLPSSMHGEGRDALLAELHPDSTIPPLDGIASFTHVRHASGSLRGDVVVRGASFDDLVALARVGRGLTVAPPAEQEASADASWLEPIVQHARLHGGGASPLRVVRDADSADGPNSYAVQRPSGSFVVTVTPEDEPATREHGTWMLIGARVEEVWR